MVSIHPAFRYPELLSRNCTMTSWHGSCSVNNFVNHKRLRPVAITQHDLDITLKDSAAAQRVKARLAVEIVVIRLSVQRKAAHAARSHTDTRRDIDQRVVDRPIHACPDSIANGCVIVASSKRGACRQHHQHQRQCAGYTRRLKSEQHPEAQQPATWSASHRRGCAGDAGDMHVDHWIPPAKIRRWFLICRQSGCCTLCDVVAGYVPVVKV